MRRNLHYLNVHLLTVSIPQQGYPLCGDLEIKERLMDYEFQYRSRVTPFAASPVHAL